jgi:hypothetical protein
MVLNGQRWSVLVCMAFRAMRSATTLAMSGCMHCLGYEKFWNLSLRRLQPMPTPPPRCRTSPLLLVPAPRVGTTMAITLGAPGFPMGTMTGPTWIFPTVFAFGSEVPAILGCKSTPMASWHFRPTCLGFIGRLPRRRSLLLRLRLWRARASPQVSSGQEMISAPRPEPATTRALPRPTLATSRPRNLPTWHLAGTSLPAQAQPMEVLHPA